MTKQTVFLILISLIFVGQVFSQSNSGISGKILDEETGETLIGVNIIIDGSSKGTSSDVDGDFLIENLPAGKYTLVFSRIGYETLRESISIDVNEMASIVIQMAVESFNLQGVTAVGDRPFTSGSSIAARELDLRIRPISTAQDMLQVAPGLVVAQHAGGGKAEQIFLRGFDADHGTDVSISVDGMPVNMVSHGHGQGYADMHFIIPETVEEIKVNKGPYSAGDGNLTTAGAIAFKTKDHLESSSISIEGGSFNTKKLTALYQIPTALQHQGGFLAGQFNLSDGPFERSQDFKRFNVFGKYHVHLTPHARISMSIGGFSSAWEASGQVPQRAIDNGTISRFGSIDDLEGGTTGRQNLNFTYEATGDRDEKLTLNSFITNYNFKLFSNFTFFLANPIDGDMIEQSDSRVLYGLNGKYVFSTPFGTRSVLNSSFGAGFRADNADVALWEAPDRIRTNQLTNAAIIERNMFLWAQETFVFSELIQLQLGLRADYFTFDVEDHLDGAVAELPHASGFTQQYIVSPKVNVVISPSNTFDIFANFGTGFHSNDARNVIISQRISDIVRTMRRKGNTEDEINQALILANYSPDQRDVITLPRAIGTEIGFRKQLGNVLNIAMAAWLLDLEQEFVYIGDAGATELSNATRRVGIDFEARAKVLPWLLIDTDINLSKGTYVDEPAGENQIALAPTLTTTGGITYFTETIESGLRYRHVGDRPATEDGSITAEGYTVLDLTASYKWKDFVFKLQAENLLDVEWNEAQFATESQLQGETESIEELHFTPGQQRSFQVGIKYKF